MWKAAGEEPGVFHARLLHITSLCLAAGWMCQQTSPCCPNCPLSSYAVTVVSSVSRLCNMAVQNTTPGTACGSEHWLLGCSSCLCCCKPVVAILDVSSCILAEASSLMPLDNLLPGATGPPTTLFWCRCAQSSPCPGDEFAACSRRHWEDCKTPQGSRSCGEKHQEHTA